MGRYAERCEGSARVLRAALIRVADTDPEAQQTLPGVELAARRMGLLQVQDEDEPVKESEELLLAAVSDLRHYGSLAACLQRLSGAANQVRERCPRTTGTRSTACPSCLSNRSMTSSRHCWRWTA